MVWGKGPTILAATMFNEVSDAAGVRVEFEFEAGAGSVRVLRGACRFVPPADMTHQRQPRGRFGPVASEDHRAFLLRGPVAERV